MLRTAIALAALVCAGDAFAQSTTSTTMDMGGGMTHVDTMGPNGAMSTSNCMNVGGGMASCNTMDISQPQRTYPTPDMSRPQTNGTALNFIGDLVARSRERSFQKKVGQMLAAGDCVGASTFAHTQSHEAISDQILRSCQFNRPAPGTTGAVTAEQFMAGQSAPPVGNAQSQNGQQTPTAFDLWCDGTETRTSKDGLQEIHFTRLYRINLENGRYCDGDCATTQVLAKVEPYSIKFYEHYGPAPTFYGSEMSVNREDGKLVQIHIGTNGTGGILAQCERRPFSGFPRQQF